MLHDCDASFLFVTVRKVCGDWGSGNAVQFIGSVVGVSDALTGQPVTVAVLANGASTLSCNKLSEDRVITGLSPPVVLTPQVVISGFTDPFTPRPSLQANVEFARLTDNTLSLANGRDKQVCAVFVRESNPEAQPVMCTAPAERSVELPSKLKMPVPVGGAAPVAKVLVGDKFTPGGVDVNTTPQP